MFLSKLPGPLRTLSWAVYLGCSWTWCIGMFLPVILVSELGNSAWFIFAIPNVIGAAAMGWTLAKPLSSEKMLAQHRAACVGFSAVTFAFHLFFLYWVASIGLMPVSYAIGAILIGSVGGFMSRWLKGLEHMLGWIALAVSLTVLARGLQHPVFGVSDPVLQNQIGIALAGLSPVFIFGFLLCPYLDVTFHRARQFTSPTAGKAAFGIGFGVVFLAMIVLTLMYAGDFARDQFNRDNDLRFGSFGKQLLITWVVFHIAVQTGFTFTAHIQAMPVPRINDLFIWLIAAGLTAAGIITVHQEQWFTYKPMHIAMLSGQLVYEIFMSFYGLLFPAYVWMFMVPIRGVTPRRTPGAIAVWIVSVLVAAPMFWLGFVNEKMLWLIPGVMTAMGARYFVKAEEKGDRRPSTVECRTSK